MRIFAGNSGFCCAEHALYAKKALFEDRAFELRVVISCRERLLYVPIGFDSLSSSLFPEDKSRWDSNHAQKAGLGFCRD